jgi:hypothetical protein
MESTKTDNIEKKVLELQAPEDDTYAGKSTYFVVPKGTRRVTQVSFKTDTAIDIAKFSVHVIF